MSTKILYVRSIFIAKSILKSFNCKEEYNKKTIYIYDEQNKTHKFKRRKFVECTTDLQ